MSDRFHKAPSENAHPTGWAWSLNIVGWAAYRVGHPDYIYLLLVSWGNSFQIHCWAFCQVPPRRYIEVC